MKDEFPLLKNTNTTYLDSAATTQKPQVVLDAINNYYTQQNANVHRAAHKLAQQATQVYEQARNDAADFIGASPKEVILTSGTTHAINILAQTLPITSESVIVLSELEHHANIIPWQQTGATLKWIPTTNGKIDEQQAKEIISQGCDLVAIQHLSNVTGSITDIQEIAKIAHQNDALIVVDGAQAAAHLEIDVKELDVDAYAFSAHKVYGPTGIGALYIQEDLLATMKPFMTGGEMIENVTKQQTTFVHGPARFEPGTPPIAQAAGFSAALKWYKQNADELSQEEVMQYAYQQLKNISEVNILSCTNPTGSLSFTIAGIDSYDIAQYLDTEDVAVRAGHHCAQIYHTSQNIPSSTRISVGAYTTPEDIDKAIHAITNAIRILGGTQ